MVEVPSGYFRVTHGRCKSIDLYYDEHAKVFRPVIMDHIGLPHEVYSFLVRPLQYAE